MNERDLYRYSNSSKRSNSYNASNIFPVKTFQNSMKIRTSELSLSQKYDLPLIQLQYTKTRKYRQNLNPIFQQLQTTQQRYKKPEKQQHHDDKPSNSDNYENKKDEKKLKVEDLKERSRILSQNVQHKDKPPIFSFGELFYPKQNRNQHIDDKQLQSKKACTEINQNRRYSICENMVKRFIGQEVAKPTNSRNIYNQIPDHDDQGEQQNVNLGQKFLKNLSQQVENIQNLVKEGQEKMVMLRREVQMHKQKNLIKQKQIILLEQQKIKLVKSSKQLESSKNSHKAKYEKLQILHHSNHKKLRQRKQELKKQESWLEEQQKQIRLIEQKIQKLLKIMGRLQEQQAKKQLFWQQIQSQMQRNQQMKMQIELIDLNIEETKHQVEAIQEDNQLLKQHQQQLISLEFKFKQETQNLSSTFTQLFNQVNRQKQFIEQEPEIDSMIKELELQIGELHERMIFADHQIQDINVKISLKERNIRNIKRSQFPKKQSKETYERQVQEKNSLQLPSRPFTKKINSSQQSQSFKPPLPTIRQQSKNTSAYQSPNNEPSPRTQEQSFHPLSSQQNQLEINSRMISKTDILRLHEQNIDKKKKYFVIESEDDNNVRSSFDGKLRVSEEMFINNSKKPSIQHRLFQQENLLMKTENQDKTQYLSADLESEQQYKESEVEQKGTKTKEIRMSNSKSKSINRKRNQSPSVQSPRLHINQSQEVFESLIDQYQKIKSNSCFDEPWKGQI